MPYTQFKEEVITTAEKTAIRQFQEVLKIIYDEKNFIIKHGVDHRQRVSHFEHVLADIFGIFTIANYYDYTSAIRSCFLDMSHDCPLKSILDLSHIIRMKDKRRSALKELLKDIEEYAFLVQEHVL